MAIVIVDAVHPENPFSIFDLSVCLSYTFLVITNASHSVDVVRQFAPLIEFVAFSIIDGDIDGIHLNFSVCLLRFTEKLIKFCPFSHSTLKLRHRPQRKQPERRGERVRGKIKRKIPKQTSENN